MRNTWKASKYLIMFLGYNCIFFLSYIIITVLVEMGILKYLSGPAKSGELAPPSTYGTAVVWILVIGLIFFKSNFKFLLANGITRRRFFEASLPALAILAVVWSLMTTLSSLVFKSMGHYALLYEYLYPGSSLAGGVIWLFAILFFSVTFGWLISLLYYRSNPRMKVGLSILPLLVVSLLSLLNSVSGGMIFGAIGRFFKTVMGFSQSPANLYTAVCSLLLTAVVIYGLNFLLMRKAEIKE